jgi:hypothetical protein
MVLLIHLLLLAGNSSSILLNATKSNKSLDNQPIGVPINKQPIKALKIIDRPNRYRSIHIKKCNCIEPKNSSAESDMGFLFRIIIYSDLSRLFKKAPQ